MMGWRHKEGLPILEAPRPLHAHGFVEIDPLLFEHLLQLLARGGELLLRSGRFLGIVVLARVGQGFDHFALWIVQNEVQLSIKRVR